MAIKRRYRDIQPQQAQVDYIDFAAGVGIRTFYAGDASSALVLSSQQFYSTNGVTQLAGASTGVNLVEFDTTIDKPFVTYGQCVVTIPFGFGSDASASTPKLHVSTALVQISNNQENVLGAYNYSSLKKDGLWGPSANETIQSYITFPFNIKRTKLKKNDTLRLRFECRVMAGDSVIIGHDPFGRTAGTQIPTQGLIGIGNDDWDVAPILKVELPVVINI